MSEKNKNNFSDWNLVKVKDIFELGRGRVISQGEISENLGDYPVYSSQSKNNGEMGRIKSYDFDGEYITWTTDGAYAGSVFYRNGKFNCTNVCGTLKAKNSDMDMRFLTFALGREAKKHVVYCGNPKLMNNVVADIKLLLPSLAEQRKIAKILSKVDEDIEKTNEVIRKTEKLKKGLTQELFTKGIGHKKFENKKIGDVCSLKYGKSRKEAGEGGIYGVYGTGGLIGHSNKFIFDKPSVLIGRKGTIDNPIFIDKPFWVVDTVFYTTDFLGIQPKWLFYKLMTISLKSYNEATGVPSINRNTLENIKIDIPSIDYQNKTISILSKVEQKIDNYKKIKTNLGILKKGLMQDLLRGQINER